MTQAAFCREWNINPKTLAKWLRIEREEKDVSFCEVELENASASESKVRGHLPNVIEVIVPVGSPQDLGDVFREPVDLRKSLNGRHGVVLDRLKEDPCSGALCVFTNRRRNRIKSFCWDGTGMWVMIKRLEQGCFIWPKGVGEKEKLALAPEALALLLDGVSVRSHRV